jgi:hypothetical protein
MTDTITAPQTVEDKLTELVNANHEHKQPSSSSSNMTDTITAPQTVEDKLTELVNANHEKKVFAVFPSGRETEIVGVGVSYESAWRHAAELLDVEKDDLRKKGYVFDHISVQNAQRIVNGLLPKPDPVKAPARAAVIPIGRGKMTSAHLQKIAKRAAREAEDISDEEGDE